MANAFKCKVCGVEFEQGLKACPFCREPVTSETTEIVELDKTSSDFYQDEADKKDRVKDYSSLGSNIFPSSFKTNIAFMIRLFAVISIFVGFIMSLIVYSICRTLLKNGCSVEMEKSIEGSKKLCKWVMILRTIIFAILFFIGMSLGSDNNFLWQYF